MFIQARALTTIYRKGVASLGSSATRWTVSVAYPTKGGSTLTRYMLPHRETDVADDTGCLIQ